jgi:ATP-dependent helicase/nuclease subunit B
MQAFLSKTAAYILEHYGDSTGEICVVLPNRRAGLFFRHRLAKQAGKTIWAPEIYAIEDFIQKLSGMQQVDNISLLFELYQLYKEEQGSGAEPFDEFAKWAQVFIQDINEIDRYLVDASQLFGNLKNIKEIENWSLSLDQLTDFQQRYLDFFQSLGGLYEKLKAKLLAKHQVYEGLAFRIVCEQLDEKIKQQGWKKIIFAGFNALNAAEERIFLSLKQRGLADVVWDTDSYYLDDTRQEAGKFLRKLLPVFKTGPQEQLRWKENLLGTDKKKITIIGAARNVVQAKVAAQLLDEMKLSEEELKSTALVLSDENLLFPVLHSIPNYVENVNVTMGYPLKNTPFAGLTEILFNLHEHSKQFGKEKREHTARFYYKELLKLLSHPYVKFLFAGSPFANRLKNAIVQRNYVFVSITELESFLEGDEKASFEKLRQLLEPWKAPADALACFDRLIVFLRTKFQEEKDRSTVETEYLFGFSKVFKRLESLLTEYDHALDLRTFRSLTKQIMAGTSLPFYGEPLSGLQVMGVLETRTLDFENLIMLSVNENVLPAAKTQHTFIPFDLKRAFSLPTYTDKDAVFAYHFYRLLQRANNIYLLYNTETDEFGKGEKSRFITQLLYELPRANPNVTIEEKLVVTENEQEALANGISVEKTPAVLGLLDKKAAKGLSPSALNTYKNCSMQFYFAQVAGLRETEEVEETIGADTLGTAVHKVLEKLYVPFLKKIVRADDVREMKKRSEKTTRDVFLELFTSHELDHGKNLLTLKVAQKFVGNFLDAEIRFLERIEKENKQLSVLELEFPLTHTMNSGERSITLHGNADRIDSIDGTVRVIDYKTGKAEAKELSVEDWNELITDPKLNKSFQLLMYAWLYSKSGKTVPGAALMSGIITFRELSAGLKNVTADESELLSPEILEKFEESLKQLLANLFDTSVPFTQTVDLKICGYCAFKTICNR